MITTKIKKLQQMANFEGDVRDGNIGSFSQGVVAGERNASKLALEVLEEILKESKSQDILHPTNEVTLIVNGANILIGSWRLEAVYPPSLTAFSEFSSSSLCGYKFLCQIEDMSGLRLIEEKNSVIELVVSNERFLVLVFKVSVTPTYGLHTFSGEFKKVESQVDKPKPLSWKPDSTKSMG